jgi:hypothetical protein
LVVVLFLVLYNFDGDLFLRLVVNALNYISESAFADDFLDFVAVANLVALFESVVPLIVVKTIVHQTFQLRWLVFVS